MKRIYFLTEHLEYGGSTKIFIAIANYLSKKNYYVKILNYGNSDCFYELNSSIDLHNIQSNLNNIRKIRRVYQIFKIRKILRNEKPNIVIAFENMAKLISVASSLFLRTKVLISERKDPFNYNANKKNNMYLRYKLSDGCVFQTEEAALYYPLSVQKKSKVIPNFIDFPQTFYSHNETKPIKQIICVARFELKQKRQDLMVKAFKVVKKIYPKLKLIFYGDGPDLNIVSNFVKDNNIKDVYFLGKKKNIFRNISVNSLYISTSDYEGIPNSLMEAMAYGLPVISTNCSPGGARLLIKNKENGVLIQKNSIVELVSAVSYLMENPLKTKKMALEARNISSSFSSKRILKMWENYIESLI